MKWINVEQQVTVTIYDEKPEERIGRWIQEWGVVDEKTGKIGWRDSCNKCGNFGYKDMNYCPNCGARMIKLK